MYQSHGELSVIFYHIQGHAIATQPIFFWKKTHNRNLISFPMNSKYRLPVVSFTIVISSQFGPLSYYGLCNPET